jgi:hypothetical protein
MSEYLERLASAVIDCGQETFKQGIKRVVNNYYA